MHEARWLHSSMVAGRKELLTKCGSCSSKSVVVVVVTVVGHALKRVEPPTQPQLPPYNHFKASLLNKPQVGRGGAQPREKRINQISTTREKLKKKYQYPRNNDSKNFDRNSSIFHTQW